MSEYLNIRPDFTGYYDSIDEKLTFFGVLNRFYDYEDPTTKTGVGGISRNWQAKGTRTSHKNTYENFLFPRIPVKPLEEFSKEDFDEIIQAIVDQQKHATGRAYSNSRLQTFKRLIKGVTEEAAKQGVCDDVLFGTSYSLQPSELRSKSLEKELVKMRKSFSIKEEYLISQAILKNPLQSGQQMGLALMFCMGLRNEEACGLNFGDIKPMQYHPKCSCLWVYKSTKRGSSELQASGKTRNMARLLPIPSILLVLLNERRHFLETEVESGALVLPPNKTVDDLPIVCSNLNYLERCNSKHLTAAGRKLLKTVHVEEDTLAYIDLELEENRLADDGIHEKDPTVYLCRRNLGTHLYVLGLTEAEIQYIIGHDIEDPYESRNDFTNEEKLYQIKLKMDQRPLVNQTDSMSEPVSELSINCSASFRNCISKDMRISAKEGFQVKLHAAALIPENDIHVDISYQNAVLHNGELYSLAGQKTPNNRTVNITYQYQNMYQHVLGKIKPFSKDVMSAETED